MQARLLLDRDHVDRARKGARELATHLARYTSRHSSISIERASLRALGVQGYHKGIPLTECVVAKLDKDKLRQGAAYWLGSVMVANKCDATAAAKKIISNGFKNSDEKLPHADIRELTRDIVRNFISELKRLQNIRDWYWAHAGKSDQLIAKVKTGQAEKDLAAVKMLIKSGAGGAYIVSPIAADVPKLVGRGAGWRGQYKLLESSEKIADLFKDSKSKKDKPFRLIWDANHLLGPEIVTHLALSPISEVACDAFTMVHSGGIHFKRAIVDQQFIFQLLAKVGMGCVVSSGDWMKSTDGYTNGHELLIAHVLMENIANQSGLPLERARPCVGLVTTSERKRSRSEMILNEIAHSQLIREFFPQIDMLFVNDSENSVTSSLIAKFCEYESLLIEWNSVEKNSEKTLNDLRYTISTYADYISTLSTELSFTSHGQINRRAHMVLERALKSLAQIKRNDILKLQDKASEGRFLSLSDKGAGIEDVFQKHKYYWNPLTDWLNK